MADVMRNTLRTVTTIGAIAVAALSMTACGTDATSAHTACTVTLSAHGERVAAFTVALTDASACTPGLVERISSGTVAPVKVATHAGVTCTRAYPCFTTGHGAGTLGVFVTTAVGTSSAHVITYDASTVTL